MHFLLTNDDGIDAPGLAALRAAVEGLGLVSIVAPSTPQSGCGHTVTTDRPLRVSNRGGAEFAIDGTPADCVRLALHNLLPEVPDWVFSGINAGGNLGVDVYHSGTVAAVREAAMRGLPGIAFSHYIARGHPLNWDRAALVLRRILPELLTQPIEPGWFWNVNLPHPIDTQAMDGWRLCPVDLSPLPLGYRQDSGLWHYNGDYHTRERKSGGDIDTCFSGRVSVSRVWSQG